MSEQSVPAIIIRRHGGPEVLEWSTLELKAPARREVRVRHRAIGVNYIDVYHRTGLYPVTLPACLGVEAAGVVEAVGAGAKGFSVGDRVAYVLGGVGSYTEARNVRADELVHLPGAVTEETAAAMMLKGLTAQFLLRRTYKVSAKDTVLVHAAAGGVGLILVQWARALGARVIAVVGSEPKAALVREHDASEVIVSTRESVPARVKELTGGKGVPVVYDSVGHDTFTGSLDSLARLGLMVSFGNASGPVPPVSLLELSKRGSLFVTRPTLFSYLSTKAELARAARELFAVVASGAVKIRIGQRFALKDAAAAHRELEARRTTGSTVLLP